MRKTVFISYRKDSGSSFARSLEQALTSRGYDVFLDVDTIDAERWADQIQREIRSRSHFLLLLTDGALERCALPKDWLRREYELARETGRNIVPVYNENFDFQATRDGCPAEMEDLFDFQMAEIRTRAFDADVETLVRRYIPPYKAPPDTGPTTGSPTRPRRLAPTRLSQGPPKLFGREEELQALNAAWADPTTNVVTIVGWGGMGKTSLVAGWVADLAAREHDGADYFDWSFYSQGTPEEGAASADAFVDKGLRFFGDEAMAKSPRSPWDKGARLAELMAERRTLLVLDGLEPLQHPPGPLAGQLKDPAITALLKGLAARNAGLCVVTTRERVEDLAAFEESTAPRWELEHLSTPAGVELLESVGVQGPADELEALVEELNGHPLSLYLIASYLARAHNGDIRKRHLVDLSTGNQGEQVARLMKMYEDWFAADPLDPSKLDDSKPREWVPTHDDEPKASAIEDELERRPFAAIVAQRIRQVQAASGRSFAVHLYGPWGSGKTSILNFLSEELCSSDSGDPWIVVHFDAWQHQHLSPPWWPLIREVYGQAQKQLPTIKGLNLWRRWVDWRFRADWLPVLATVLLIVLSTVLVTDAFEFSRFLGLSKQVSAGDAVEKSLKILVALATASAAFLTASRSLLFGSAHAASAYLELKADPLRPLVDLFGKLVSEVEHPIAIFIDDLDRCRPQYVVNLLEGIQTLFRDAPVTYVVAADRDWLRTSFERQYVEFRTEVGDAGRPLGFLFLEKVFQISAAVPAMRSAVSDEYWNQLLHVGGASRVKEAAREKEREAEDLLGNAYSEAELNEVIDSHGDDPHLEQSLRAAASKRLTSARARKHSRHILSPFRPLLESSPRSMKRLVNAFGLQRAVGILINRRVRVEVLARWTILELRWPVVADLLRQHPELIDEVREDPRVGDSDSRVPDPLRSIIQEKDLLKVLCGEPSDEGLSTEELYKILGQKPAKPEETEGIGDQGSSAPFVPDGVSNPKHLAILRVLGLFNRPADPDCLAALRREPAIPGLTEPLVEVDEDDWIQAIADLVEHGLLTRVDPGGKLETHPLVREYFARRLREESPEAWKEAHGRLFEHLINSTEYQPATLEGLQPLYQAVAHGCHAGRQQEACDIVYRERILRGRDFYSARKLGALGANLRAVACFFESRWSRVVPSLKEVDQAWLLNEAAFHLRASGRVIEALEPMRASMEMDLKLDRWGGAARSASNLSELELTLGEVSVAVRDAEQAVDYADRSDDAFQRMGNRTTLADAMHQAGSRDEALARFQKAEAMQAERQPQYPLLYSLQGFRYCDMLLADAERAAAGDGGGDEIFRQCGEVEARAAQTLEWVTPQNWILDIALDRLTLGRARLYRAILEGSSLVDAETEIEQAVDGLRAAGTADHLPRGLLTRAWLRSAQGETAAARADLDDAEDIAERGPMPLYLADVHLYRARLFHNRDALAEARRLLEKHGYGRRLGELAHLEARL